MKKIVIMLTLLALVLLSGAKNDKYGDFLGDLGYKFSYEAVTEFVIPGSFDSFYENYNELQKEAGFDLLPYAGKKCEMRTYELLNHPFGKCRANLIIFEGKIIGGDISSVELDGFMEPLIGA